MPQPRQARLLSVLAEHSEEVEKAIDDIPHGDRWLRHLHADLLPFWDTPVALGSPVGNFPTYRHNDGSAVDPDRPGPEFIEGNVVKGIVWLDRDHVRMKSRQIYAYGVAFHLTGDAKYLEYAVAGARYLLEKAVDLDGVFYSYLDPKTGRGGPPNSGHRTSQDLAYALQGIAFLYYLTRSDRYARVLVDTHEYIRSCYYDDELQHFRWVLADSPEDDAKEKELVAQLDQLYAYMLLAGPILPTSRVPETKTKVENPRADWINRLEMLSHRLMQQFYSPSTKMFWGRTTSWKDQRLGERHTDFGHTVKTFWLISLIGQLTDDYEMFTAAQRRAARILDWAYLPDTGSWARGLNKRGWLDENKEWWTYCELDQVAGALAMNDPFYARYIAQTYKYWFKHMVDHQDHEIWHWVDGKTNLPDPGFPKQHAWKNAMHSFEHVLVSYLVCQQLHRNEVPLYYAFEDEFVEQCKPDEEPDQHGVTSLKIKEKAALREINPYFYNGKVKEEKLHKKPVKSLTNRYEVVFTDVAVGSLAWPPRRGGRLSAADY